jgi:glucosamine 6-phosphate synthetase-like amidotransferase/phosphosugar isomerase protein
VIRLPEHYGLLSPILHVAALQLLAYHTAVRRTTAQGLEIIHSVSGNRENFP